MGTTTNKIRQIFNLFLILALLSVVVGVAVWFLTAPEQRTQTFWISMGAVLFSALLTTLFASKIVARADAGRQTVHSFSQFFLVILYMVFTVTMAFVNAYKNFSTVSLFLIHVAGGAIFLIPLVMLNMAALKSSGSDRKMAREQRQNLTDASHSVSRIAEDLEKAMPKEKERLLPLRALADDLNFADPTPAPGSIDEDLIFTIKNLQDAADHLLVTGEADRENRFEMVLTAAIKAKRALETRNDAVLRAKQGR